MKYLVILGNPVNGFAFVGPFDSHSEAGVYAERRGFDQWWVASMMKQGV